MSRFEVLSDSSSEKSLTPPPVSQNRQQQSDPPNPPLHALPDDDDTPPVTYTNEELLAAIARAQALKLRGNTQFAAQQFSPALESYREGLVELPLVSRKGKECQIESQESVEVTEDGLTSSTASSEVTMLQGENYDDQVVELRGVFFGNVAATLLKLKRWNDAVIACDDSLLDKPNYVKVLHRRAVANEAINSWSSLTSALEDYETLNSLSSTTSTIPAPLQKAISESLRRLPPMIAEQQEKEKNEVLLKLKDLGNTVLGKFGFSTDNFKFTQQAGGGYSMNFEQ